MKICIIGGGNIGTLMAAEFSLKCDEIIVYTKKEKNWNEIIQVFDSNKNHLFNSNKIYATHSLKESVLNADMIWITTPAFTFNDLAKQLEPFVDKGQVICIVPGTGGAEFAFQNLLKKGCILLGLQRVHSIARLKESGKSVFCLGKKSMLYFSTVPIGESINLKVVLENLFNIPCKVLPNYLNITLTPSNSILHTTRLYSMFKNYEKEEKYHRNYLFYEEWNDETSSLILDADKELIELCNAIDLDLSGIVPLGTYYENNTASTLTKKIRNIDAFKGLTSPMIKTDNGWIVDWNSRYFTADFPYGLKIILDIAQIFDVETKTLKKIWNWYDFQNPNVKRFNLKMDKQDFLSIYK